MKPEDFRSWVSYKDQDQSWWLDAMSFIKMQHKNKRVNQKVWRKANSFIVENT